MHIPTVHVPNYYFLSSCGSWFSILLKKNWRQRRRKLTERIISKNWEIFGRSSGILDYLVSNTYIPIDTYFIIITASKYLLTISHCRTKYPPQGIPRLATSRHFLVKVSSEKELEDVQQYTYLLPFIRGLSTYSLILFSVPPSLKSPCDHRWVL